MKAPHRVELEELANAAEAALMQSTKAIRAREVAYVRSTQSLF